MHLVQHLLDLFRPEDPPAEDPQAYRETFVDLLVWTMFVDRHVALAEREALEQAVAGLDWQGGMPVDEFIRESTARARSVIDDAVAAKKYLQEMAARVVNAEDRRRLLKACDELVRADAKLRPEEAKHLKAVAQAFGL